MVFELHIWGPSFGLPSIDAQCLAAVAYLKQCISPDAWRLIPSSDPAINPLGQLPALKDGESWVAGYGNIVNYLRVCSFGEQDLDKNLSPSQQADSAAYTSFIESRGQPLLDLSLYVSTQNYTKYTKPALGDILKWPNSWFVPHKLREAAKKRSEHLGLSGLDVDTAQDEKEDNGLTAQIPTSLRKPRQTLSSILGRDLKRSKFRLDAVTADFLEPLEEMLGGKTWLVSDSVTSVDCLVLAYLALMRGPKEIPHSWLRDAMRSEHPELEGWVQEKQELCFGPRVSVATVLRTNPESRTSGLPWQSPSEQAWQDVLNATVLNVAEATPWLGAVLGSHEVKLVWNPQSSAQSAAVNKYSQKQEAIARIQDLRLRYSQLFGSSICLLVATGLLFWNGMLVLPRRAPVPRARNFGEAGAMLGLGLG